MSKFKDIWNGENKSFVRYAIVATCICLMILMFNRKTSIFRWIQAGITIRTQNERIEQYRREIKEMEDRIQDLSTDRDSIETFARENFYFAAEGEDVYIIEE